MKIKYLPLILIFILFGCAPKPKPYFSDLPNTPLVVASFEEFERTHNENYDTILELFSRECQSSKVINMYPDACQGVYRYTDAKRFIHDYFQPYKIFQEDGSNQGLLTGYYEPELFGSLEQGAGFEYPVYAEPNDLITVDLSTIYPELKHKRLRGRIEGKKLVPYYSRQELRDHDVNASVLCYVDNKIDLFFLEVQGSGRVTLDDNRTLFIGYANQNGQRYRSIGRYLVEIGALTYEEVSLQSIRRWLVENPSRVDELLDYNPSQVFFQKKDHAASGALGIELTPMRSVAVDRKFIPLGSLLYINATENNSSNNISGYVFAHDTGGAIKGSVRADYFLGFGKEAGERAGTLKAPLQMWILLPKTAKAIQ